MAKKSKSLNPADAFRKAQRAKEIKRNKLERKKAREEAHTKKDTKSIEAEIRQLENLEKLTASEQTRLKDLKAELIQFRKGKDPHHGTAANGNVIIDPVTGLPSTLAGTAPEGSNSLKTGSAGSSRQDSRTMDWFGPDGKLLEPEKSFYYDPVFNPFGVPPPGMPMRMKASVELNALPSSSEPLITPSNNLQEKDSKATQGDEDQEENSEEDTSDDESTDEEDEDEEIPLPEGPPPDPVVSEDDDDDIPLPEGPPPVPVVPRAEPFISRPTFNRPPPQQPHLHPSMLPPPPFYPPPLNLVPGTAPPPMINSFGALPFPIGPNGLPLPPPSFNNFHPLPVAPASAQLPPKPTTQANSMARVTSTDSAGPDKPVVQASATLTALPQLRDLKREATSFVPSAIRKKRKELDRRADLAGLGDSNRIQAAPETGDDLSLTRKDGHITSSTSKPLVTSLIGALKRDGILVDGQAENVTNIGGGAEKDDYDKFVQSLGDVL
ncbi:WW domain binding protein 11-domain-containing protein [Melampsora americana]|nr:WW domain binding protein 11-domain-containing protein [Melampsora americana]